MTPAGNAFARLQSLLDDLPPATGQPVIALHLGETRLGDPTPLLAPLCELEQWTRYPPLPGTPQLREAYSGWLRRRFGAGTCLDEERIAIEPTPGTKQAVATCIALAVTRARARGVKAPVVVLPNPFYPTYVAATDAAGAQALFYDVNDADLLASLACQLDQAGDSIAALVLCNPGNPLGNILPASTLISLSHMAFHAQATLLVDECYTDLVPHSPPPAISAWWKPMQLRRARSWFYTACRSARRRRVCAVVSLPAIRPASPLMPASIAVAGSRWPGRRAAPAQRFGTTKSMCSVSNRHCNAIGTWPMSTSPQCPITGAPMPVFSCGWRSAMVKGSRADSGANRVCA